MLDNNKQHFIIYLIKSCITSLRQEFLGGILFTTLYIFAQLYLTFYYKALFDKPLSYKEENNFILITTSFITLTWVAITLFQYFQGIVSASLFPKIRSHVMVKIFDIIKGKNFEFYTKHSPNTIKDAVYNIALSLEKVIQILILSIYPFVVILVIYSIILLKLSILLFLANIAFITLLFFLIFNYRASNLAISYKAARSHALLSNYLADFSNNIIFTNFITKKDKEIERFKFFLSNSTNDYRVVLQNIEQYKTKQSILTSLYYVLLFYFVISIYSNQLISFGNAILVMMLSFQMINMIWNINFNILALNKEIGTLKEAAELFYSQSTDHAQLDIISNNSNCQHPYYIDIQNVSLLINQKQTLKNISLCIKPYSKIGIIGQSGTGKSTLLKLILGLYESYEGQILINNIELKQYNIEEYRLKFSIVEQDPYLLNRSLLENVYYGSIFTNMSDFFSAKVIKLFGCTELLGTTKNKDSIVNCKQLSFGQRKRILLARAFIRDTPFVILDEPLSGFNLMDKQEIHNTIEELSHGKTLIYTSHEPDFLNNMDIIIKMHDGKIQEVIKNEDLNCCTSR